MNNRKRPQAKSTRRRRRRLKARPLLLAAALGSGAGAAANCGGRAVGDFDDARPDALKDEGRIVGNPKGALYDRGIDAGVDLPVTVDASNPKGSLYDRGFYRDAAVPDAAPDVRRAQDVRRDFVISNPKGSLYDRGLYEDGGGD